MRKQIKGGGTGQPAASINTTHTKYTLDDSQLVKLQNELSKQQERRNKLADASDESKRELQDAQRHFDACESRHLAGRTDARSLELARKALDEARVRHARVHEDYLEAARLAETILPEAITTAQHAALAELRDRIRRETQDEARRLAALLAQAKVHSDNLRRLQDAAVDNFTVNSMIRLKISLIGKMDLGEYGYVGPHADLPDLSCRWLTNVNVNQPSMYSVWLRELDAYLQKTPEAMAQEDVDSRRIFLARDEADYKENLVRLQAQKELEEKAEKYAGISWNSKLFKPD